MGACSTTTVAMQKMGCKTSGGRLFCNDRNGAETVKHPGVSALRRPKQSGDLGPMGACHATTEAMRKMGRVRSGGPHATSRPSRRRDLEPWAPAPQRPEPAEDGAQDIRGMSALRRPKRSGDLGPMGTRSASASKIKKG